MREELLRVGVASVLYRFACFHSLAILHDYSDDSLLSTGLVIETYVSTMMWADNAAKSIQVWSTEASLEIAIAVTRSRKTLDQRSGQLILVTPLNKAIEDVKSYPCEEVEGQ